MVDKRGKQLMAWVRDQGWKVLNGRCSGDAEGNCTYENRGSKSTLDYVIVEGSTEANMRVMGALGVVSDGHALLLVQVLLQHVGSANKEEIEWAQRIRK